jgi:DNA polymerase I-like protein with 3'-5' exonuclease and polymerase domains
VSNYLALDIENDNSKLYGEKAGNFQIDPIVAVGYKTDTKHFAKYYSDPGFDGIPHLLEETDVMIVHNATHDLLFLWRITRLQAFFERGGRIWDTQLAENILTGQQTKYASLRGLAVDVYGCKEREKLMEPYWDKGLQTSQIPRDIVIEDVMNDVLDTEAIYLQQVVKAEELGMTQLIQDRMDGLLATIEMKYNGFKVDRETLIRNRKELQARLDEKKQALLLLAERHWK